MAGADIPSFGYMRSKERALLVLRAAALTILMLAQTSCTLSFPVTAWFRDGSLTFIVDGRDRDEWCWDDFKIIDYRARTAWEFNTHELAEAQRCWRGVLAYGRAPAGAEIKTPPKPLELGRIYVIEGRATGMLHGAFYLYGGAGQITVQKLPSDDPRVIAISDAHYAPRAPTQ